MKWLKDLIGPAIVGALTIWRLQAVTDNNVEWLKKALDNHEARITALETTNRGTR